MSTSINIDIKGLADLDKKLMTMKQDFSAKSIVSSAYSSNKVVQDQIKENITTEGLVSTGFHTILIGMVSESFML